MAFKMRGFTPLYKKSESNSKPKKTYTGKIYESLDAVNDAIKNKKYKKRADGIYKFNFRTESGEISTKTLRKK